MIILPLEPFASSGLLLAIFVPFLVAPTACLVNVAQDFAFLVAQKLWLLFENLLPSAVVVRHAKLAILLRYVLLANCWQLAFGPLHLILDFLLRDVTREEHSKFVLVILPNALECLNHTYPSLLD